MEMRALLVKVSHVAQIPPTDEDIAGDCIRSLIGWSSAIASTRFATAGGNGLSANHGHRVSYLDELVGPYSREKNP